MYLLSDIELMTDSEMLNVKILSISLPRQVVKGRAKCHAKQQGPPRVTLTAVQEWGLKQGIIIHAVEVEFSFQFQNYRLAFKTFLNSVLIQILYVKPLDQCIVKFCAERFVPVLISSIKSRQQKMSSSLIALVWTKH